MNEMNDKKKIVRFNETLNFLTEKEYEYKCSEYDDDFAPEIKLAQYLKSLDLSNESKIKEPLRKKFLTRLCPKNQHNKSFEINDDDLKNVAGGSRVQNEKEMNICNKCGRLFTANKTQTESICPQCLSSLMS